MFFRNLSLRRKLIFCLDCILFTLFVLSLSPRLTGLPLHEIIGTALLLTIFVHVLVEWKWFKNYIGRLFKLVTKRDIFNLVLNCLLFVALIFEIVSGLVISQVLAPYVHIKTINDSNWRFWHNQVSTISMFLAGFHLALSLDRIFSYFSKRARPFTDKKAKININFSSLLLRTLILVLLASVVAILTFLILGNPTVKRLYTGDEIARFRPTLDHGLIQLLGETLLLVFTCLVARRWLKVRL